MKFVTAIILAVLLSGCASSERKMDYTDILVEAATKGVPSIEQRPCKGDTPSIAAKWSIPVHSFPEGARGRKTSLNVHVELAEDCPEVK